MRPAGHLSLALLGTAVACVVALHIIRPRISPIERRLSDYALGPYGWVMDLAFATTAAGLTALAVMLTGSAGRPRVVPAALIVAAVGLVLSAIYRLDATDDTATSIHRWASGTAGAAAVVAAVGWSVVGTGRPRPRQRGLDQPLAVVALALAVLSPVLHDTFLTGINQRLVWAALIAWSVVVRSSQPRA
jgi:Protein of unknown function (DUF998)